MNLTYAKEIVKQVKTYKFIEGYVIAVFERQGDSRICRGIFNRKDGTAKIARWKKWIGLSHFDSFAVSTFTQWRHEYTRSIQHYSQLHELDIDYTLDFHVVDAEAVCIHIDSDPLSRFCEEINRSIGDALATKPWSKIVGDFPSLAQEVLEELDERESRFDQLNRFGGELGLHMIGLKMVRHLQRKDLQVVDREDKTNVETQLFDLDHEAERHRATMEQEGFFQDELRDKDHRRDLRQRELEENETFGERERKQELMQHELDFRKKRDQQLLENEKKMAEAIIKSLETAMVNIAQNINSGEEFENAINTVSPILGQLSGRGQNPGISSSDGQHKAQTLGSGGGTVTASEGLNGNVQEAIELIRRSYCEDTAKREFEECLRAWSQSVAEGNKDAANNHRKSFKLLFLQNQLNINSQDRAKLQHLCREMAAGS